MRPRQKPRRRYRDFFSFDVLSFFWRKFPPTGQNAPNPPPGCLGLVRSSAAQSAGDISTIDRPLRRADLQILEHRAHTKKSLIGCGSPKAQRACARSTAHGHYRARRRHKKPATAARTKRIPHQTPTALRPFARPLPSANGVSALQPRVAAARPLPRGPRPAKRFNPDGVAPPIGGPASVQAGPALRLNHDSTSSPG